MTESRGPLNITEIVTCIINNYGQVRRSRATNISARAKVARTNRAWRSLLYVNGVFGGDSEEITVKGGVDTNGRRTDGTEPPKDLTFKDELTKAVDTASPFINDEKVCEVLRKLPSGEVGFREYLYTWAESVKVKI